jgi:hypothetical protein
LAVRVTKIAVTAALALGEIAADNCELYDVWRPALARCQAIDILDAVIQTVEQMVIFSTVRKK